MPEELFFEIGIILIIAAVIAMCAHRLRQPLIIAYIVTGILVGSSLFGLSASSELFEVLSKIGVAFLLFTVGLGLNWRSVKDVGALRLLPEWVKCCFVRSWGFSSALRSSLIR